MLLKANGIRTLRFGEFDVDRARRKLIRSSQPIALPAKAFDLLVFMVENPGRLLSKDELLQSVWPDAIVEESNLTQNVFLLRKALGAEGQDVIATLPGRGYQFTAHVVELPVPDSVGNVPAPTLQTIEATHSHLVFEEETEDRIAVWQSPLALIFVAAGVLLLGAVGWLGWQRYEDRVGGPPVQVVLADFEGSTGDTALDQALLSAMRVDLSQSPFVSVLSTAAVRKTLTQMMHKPDDPVTANMARDICERNSSQAMLRGTLARSGAHYLITEEAINCVDGAPLASAKGEASKPDDLPRSVDKLTATLRHSLGESRRTIARFNAPLFPTNTGSIEALEAFSQGISLTYQGKLSEGIGLLQRAVELDPQFAAAYLSLSNTYANEGDRGNERLYVRKAFELRAVANRPTQLYIVAHYNSAITGDLYASQRNYRDWADLYPREIVPWAGLAQIDRELGDHAASVAAMKRAIDLNPHIQTLYYGLALEQMHAGDLAGSHATGELAIARGQDGELLRSQILVLANLQHDEAQMAAQVAWADSHPGATHVRLKQMEIALTEGRTNDAMRFLAQAREILERQGLTSLSTQYAQELAAEFADVEDMNNAKQLLNIGPIDPEEPGEVLALAKTGHATEAINLINAEHKNFPESTEWNHIYGPIALASIALAKNDSHAAITALEPTLGFEGATLDYNWLRGRAFLLAKQPQAAELEFRRVLAHPEVNPESFVLPLSQLGLARALAQQGKTNAATEAYQSFLHMWRTADIASPILQAARGELAVLTAAKVSPKPNYRK